jgi:hypothetical protein
MTVHRLRAILFFPALAMIAFGAAACLRGEAALPADQQWTTYTDPGAHAFTVEAPAGWQVAGGTQLLSKLDTREGVVMRSPDGAIQLFFGDPALPLFTVPSPALEMNGLHEGMSVSPNPGMNVYVAAYVPGQRFAAQWGAVRVSQICGQVALTSSRPRPEVAGAVDGLYRQIGISGSTQAGDAGFDCVLSNGAQAKGYALTATQLSNLKAFRLWNVATAVGFIAPADRVAEARALLAHVIESYRVDPTWAAKQGGPANYSELVVQTNAAIARTIMAATTDSNLAPAQAAAEVPTGPTAAPVAPVETPAPSPVQANLPLQAPPYYGPVPSIAGLQGQGPPMDMSWAIRSQMANQVNGDAAVHNAFNSAYAMLAQARADGHPVEGQLVLGNNPNTYDPGDAAERADRTGRAIEDHTLRATRGCERLLENARGDRWYSC